MNIVVASDDNYAPHLETLLVSIGENNKSVESIKVYVFDGGLSDKSKQSIISLHSVYENMTFTFHLMTEEIITRKFGKELSNDRSLSAYARIFIPEIVDGDRALYFDVDAIVLEDLNELYFTDLNEYAIAGVVDTNPISRHRNVGLEDSQVYINSGMILWNLEMCRNIDFVQQCIDFVYDREGVVDAMDQGTINGVLGSQGLIKPIHPRYNAFTSLFQLNQKQVLNIYGLNSYYSDDEISEARDNPVFVHFTPNMTTRPWVKNCKHPLKEKYWRYRNQTSYKEYNLDNDRRKIKIKILSFIYNNISVETYRLIISLLRH